MIDKLMPSLARCVPLCAGAGKPGTESSGIESNRESSRQMASLQGECGSPRHTRLAGEEANARQLLREQWRCARCAVTFQSFGGAANNR